LTQVRRALVVAAAAALSVLGPAASASADEAGKPGYCTDDAGVTVVVDFRALGGDVVVRCAEGPGGHGFTGLDALAGAGFSVAGTQRWGMQFVCRIQGRPTAHEDLEIPGNDTYHEDCDDTPPDAAYWTYWYAPNGGPWKYSSVSAASRTTIKGGFEGWSFHLGSDSAAAPPVAPRHAVEAPTSKPPGSQNSGGTSSSPTSSASTSHETTSASGPTEDPTTDRPRPNRHHRASTKPPSGAVTSRPTTKPQTLGTPDVVTSLPDEPDDDGGSAMPFLVGTGILVLLGAGAGATAWRRSHRG
jgi:hypothetical protein